MKKLMILVLTLVFLAPAIEARPKNNLPFAPKAKTGKHKTWKQKPVRKNKVINCVKFWN